MQEHAGICSSKSKAKQIGSGLPPPSINETGKPVHNERTVSEKKRAHLERMRNKVLERKKQRNSCLCGLLLLLTASLRHHDHVA